MGARSEEGIVKRLQVAIKLPGEVGCHKSLVSLIYLILQASPVLASTY